eukprot:472566_1
MSTAAYVTCGIFCLILLSTIWANIMTSKHFNKNYNENSYQSIINAFTKGITSEFDLRLTADDEIVIFHDSHTAKLSTIDSYIGNMNLKDIENKILISDGVTKQTYIPTKQTHSPTKQTHSQKNSPTKPTNSPTKPTNSPTKP